MTSVQAIYKDRDNSDILASIGVQKIYNFKQRDDFKLAITNLGARIVKLETCDRNGVMKDVVFGFDTIDEYLNASEPYYGATIGRYANRIKNASFSIDRIPYHLAANNNGNSLHGGPGGFHNVIWDVLDVGTDAISMQYMSKDGEEGFPGNLKVVVTYKIEKDNKLAIIYRAESDKKTVINLTNHAFFNLNGMGSGTILDHNITVYADRYLPIDEKSISTELYEHVALSPFDFRKGRNIGASIQADHPQLKYGNGYDHCFVLNKGITKTPELAAAAYGDLSGVLMKVYTTEPGLQLYTGNYLTGNNLLRGGYTDDFRTAFCLETQHFPDSPNQPAFPSTILEPNMNFESKTIYEFSLED